MVRILTDPNPQHWSNDPCRRREGCGAQHDMYGTPKFYDAESKTIPLWESVGWNNWLIFFIKKSADIKTTAGQSMNFLDSPLEREEAIKKICFFSPSPNNQRMRNHQPPHLTKKQRKQTAFDNDPWHRSWDWRLPRPCNCKRYRYLYWNKQHCRLGVGWTMGLGGGGWGWEVQIRENMTQQMWKKRRGKRSNERR